VSLARALSFSLALALLASLVACGGPLEQARWARPVDVDPRPGRVPLVLESSGAAQNVALTAPRQDRDFRRPLWLCTTPCTLYVPPGRVGLYAGGGRVREGLTVVAVGGGAQGTSVRLRAPDARAFATARTALTGGTLVAIVGTAFLLDGPLETYVHGSSGPITIGIGAGLLAAGIGFIVPSTIALNRLATGAERVGPASATPRVSLGAAPLPGGGLVRLGLRF
jgi:hypothetical protein